VAQQVGTVASQTQMLTNTLNQRRSRRGIALGAALTVALAIAGCGGSGSSSSSNSAAPKRATPVAATPTQLRALVKADGHPVFWSGAFNGTYELTTIADGRTYIRYLPPGIPIGDPSLHLTIGTYVRPSAPYDSVKKAATGKKATVRTLGSGALAVQYHNRPQSVYLVFPGALYEVEVYDPSAATAMHLATTGKIVPIP
jgi:hypothetical protein